MKGRFLDYWARAETGPIVPEKDFDLKRYWPRVNALARKYKKQNTTMTHRPDGRRTTRERVEGGVRAGPGRGFPLPGYVTRDPVYAGRDRRDDPPRSSGASARYGRGRKDAHLQGIRRLRQPEESSCGDGACARADLPRYPYSSVIMSYLKEPSNHYVHFQGIISKINGMPTTPGSPWKCSRSCTGLPWFAMPAGGSEGRGSATAGRFP